MHAIRAKKANRKEPSLLPIDVTYYITGKTDVPVVSDELYI